MVSYGDSGSPVEDSHDLVIMAVILVARRVARDFDANVD
jgi:hypothetical protein